MVIYKTFLKVLNKCKFPIILYTGILLFFAGFNMSSNSQTTDFTATKPRIAIINYDKEEGITKDFINYLHENTEVVDIENTEQKIKDALFYREIHYVIYIPEHYNENFLAGKNPQLEIKSTGEYQASLAGMITERYVKVAKLHASSGKTEDELYKSIKDTLAKKADVEVTSKLDTTSLSRLTFFYNFSAYSFLAIAIYVISTIMMIFKSEKINKRTVIGSTDYKNINFKLLIANSGFCIIIWAFFVIMARVLIGDIAFKIQGLYMIVNSLVFLFSAITLGFLVSLFVKNKNTITALVNIIGIGSSFLCGVFVPMDYLPDFVLKIAHILPTYWFVKNNELIGTTEKFTSEVLKNLGINALVVIGFGLLFFVLTNIVSKKKIKAE